MRVYNNKIIVITADNLNNLYKNRVNSLQAKYSYHIPPMSIPFRYLNFYDVAKPVKSVSFQVINIQV